MGLLKIFYLYFFTTEMSQFLTRFNSWLLIWFTGFLTAPTVKNLPAMQEAWVQSLGQEDPLENEMAIHCSILAWRIPWT